MTNAERERAIACLRLALELDGDGGMTPFTDKEYELMEQLLVEITVSQWLTVLHFLLQKI